NCLLWDLRANQPLRQFSQHGLYVHVWALAVSADGKQVLSGDEKGKIFLWNVATGQEVRAFVNPAGDVWELAFLPESVGFVSLDSSGIVRTWDMKSGESKESVTVPVKDKTRNFPRVFSPDGDRLLIGQSDGFLRLTEVRTGKELRLWKGHTAP